MKEKIAVCIPSRGIVYSEFAESLWNTMEHFRCVWPDVEICVVWQHYTPMPDCRIRVVEKALLTGATHILFVDDDMLLPPTLISELYGHGKDIVTGLCWNKSREQKSKPMVGWYIPGYPVVTWTSEWYWPNVFQIDGCGLASCMIRREVFETLDRWFDWNWTQTYIRNGHEHEHTTPQGEDLFFCKQAKDAGYEIWCDSGILVKHMLFHHTGDGYDNSEYWVEYFPDDAELEYYRAGNPRRIMIVDDVTPLEYWANHKKAMEQWLTSA